MYAGHASPLDGVVDPGPNAAGQTVVSVDSNSTTVGRSRYVSRRDPDHAGASAGHTRTSYPITRSWVGSNIGAQDTVAKPASGGYSDTHARRPLPAGTPAPDFELPVRYGETVKLSDYRGRPVVLVFYPADWSPVCGDQLAIYAELTGEFDRYDAAVVVGISVDARLVPRRLRQGAGGLPFTLLSDFEPKGAVARAIRGRTTPGRRDQRAGAVRRRPRPA